MLKNPPKSPKQRFPIFFENYPAVLCQTSPAWNNFISIFAAAMQGFDLKKYSLGLCYGYD